MYRPTLAFGDSAC